MPITEATRRGWRVAHLREREALVRQHLNPARLGFHPSAERLRADRHVNDYAFCEDGFDVAALQREACSRLVYAHSLTASPRTAPWGTECAALDNAARGAVGGATAGASRAVAYLGLTSVRGCW